MCAFVLLAAMLPAAPHPVYELPAWVREMIEKSDALTLFSLGDEADLGGSLRGRTVVGSADLTNDAKARERIRGFLASLKPTDPAVSPRLRSLVEPWHGLRATRNGKPVDLLIDARWGRIAVGTPAGQVGLYRIPRASLADWDALAATARLPVAHARRKEPRLLTRLLLEKAEKVEVISLGPGDYTGKGELVGSHRVLGKTPVTDANLARRLLDEILVAVPPTRNPGLFVCGRFDPRHALRLTCRGVTVDILLCFRSNMTRMSVPDMASARATAAKTDVFSEVNTAGDTALWECEAEPLLDEILRKAKVPLAPKAAE